MAEVMTTEEWIARELSKAPERSEAWCEETRRLWGYSVAEE